MSIKKLTLDLCSLALSPFTNTSLKLTLALFKSFLLFAMAHSQKTPSLHDLSDQVHAIKEKITSGEFLNIMNTMGKLYKEIGKLPDGGVADGAVGVADGASLKSGLHWPSSDHLIDTTH